MDTPKDCRSLMIGATGMLAPALHHAATHATHMLSLARHATQFTPPPGVPKETYEGYDVDYENTKAVEQLLNAHGPFATALTWIRPKALPLRDLVARHMRAHGHLIEVMGSAASRPGALADQRRATMAAFPDITYSQLILGFMPKDETSPTSRWLTHDEIATAACAILDTPVPRTIVGHVEPWEARPQ